MKTRSGRGAAQRLEPAAGPAVRLGHGGGTALAADVADATRLRFVLLAPRQVWDLVVGIVDHLVSGG